MTSHTGSIPQDLLAITGENFVRVATARDAIDGIMPRYVVQPGTVEEAAAVLSLAQSRQWAVSSRGSGSNLVLGNIPTGLDLILDSSRLNRVLEYNPGDLVVKVQSGMRLSDLQSVLAGSNQMLALDPPEDDGTLGGIIATNASGPRRYRYGTVRDLLIGITFVLPGGAIAKAGGKVVKNVAGYDMGKLFTGSLGTLGFIAEATFRLHPSPANTAAVLVDTDSPEAVGRSVQELLHSSLTPIAIEVDWVGKRFQLAAVFEGDETPVNAQTVQAGAMLSNGASARVETGPAGERLLQGMRRKPWSGGQVGIQVSVPVSQLPGLLASVLELNTTRETIHRVCGRAGTGVFCLALTVRDATATVRTIETLRRLVASREGFAVVVQAPPEVKNEIDVWGPTGDAWPLMRRVKAEFDPQNIMNPGRYIGRL